MPLGANRFAIKRPPRRSVRGVLAAASLLLLAASCLRGGSLHETRSEPVELGGSLEPMRACFNAHRELPRAILLLSPT